VKKTRQNKRLEPGSDSIRADKALDAVIRPLVPHRVYSAPIGLTANSRGKLLFTLNTPAIMAADHAAPCRQALGGMLLHPLRELRRAHQAGLHGDRSEVRGADGFIVAICRGGETAEHGMILIKTREPRRYDGHWPR
jgi:hypothetical protein